MFFKHLQVFPRTLSLVNDARSFFLISFFGSDLPALVTAENVGHLPYIEGTAGAFSVVYAISIDAPVDERLYLRSDVQAAELEYEATANKPIERDLLQQQRDLARGELVDYMEVSELLESVCGPEPHGVDVRNAACMREEPA